MPVRDSSNVNLGRACSFQLSILCRFGIHTLCAVLYQYAPLSGVFVLRISLRPMDPVTKLWGRGRIASLDQNLVGDTPSIQVKLRTCIQSAKRQTHSHEYIVYLARPRSLISLTFQKLFPCSMQATRTVHSNVQSNFFFVCSISVTRFVFLFGHDSGWCQVKSVRSILPGRTKEKKKSVTYKSKSNLLDGSMLTVSIRLYSRQFYSQFFLS